jgi:hypothetical protein
MRLEKSPPLPRRTLHRLSDQRRPVGDRDRIVADVCADSRRGHLEAAVTSSSELTGSKPAKARFRAEKSISAFVLIRGDS